MNLDDGLLYTHIELKLTQLNELRTREEGRREKNVLLLLFFFFFLFIFHFSSAVKKCAGERKAFSMIL